MTVRICRSFVAGAASAGALAWPPPASAIVPPSPLDPFAGLPQLDTIASVPGVEETAPIGASALQHGERSAFRYVRPGDRVELAVAPRRAPVRIALLRVTAAGAPMRVVAERRLREGRFRATVPPGTGLRYALRVAHTAGLYLYAPRGPRTTLQVDRTLVRRGEPLTTTLTNLGDVPVMTYGDWAFERADAGGWTPVPQPVGPIMTPASFLVPPGGSSTGPATVWETLRPGHHRIVRRVSAGLGGPAFPPATAQLDVVGQ